MPLLSHVVGSRTKNFILEEPDKGLSQRYQLSLGPPLHVPRQSIHIIVYVNGAPWSFGVQDMCGHNALALLVRHKLD